MTFISYVNFLPSFVTLETVLLVSLGAAMMFAMLGAFRVRPEGTFARRVVAVTESMLRAPKLDSSHIFFPTCHVAMAIGWLEDDFVAFPTSTATTTLERRDGMETHKYVDRYQSLPNAISKEYLCMYLFGATFMVRLGGKVSM